MTRKTKIIATLGPATESSQMLAQLLDAGVNIFRLNMSHAKHEWVRRIVPEIRRIAHEQNRAVGILLDTQGPAIRTGDVASPIQLAIGERFVFTTDGSVPSGVKSTTVNYPGFAGDVEVGRPLIVDNGEMKMRILSKTPAAVECEVLTAGQLGSRRHINLPGVRVSLPALTDKDKADVKLALEVGVDFIALSFVRDPEDIAELRHLLRDRPNAPWIVAKIEHQFAVDHFEAIARASDAVMVARGDLGVECAYWELPIIQRRIVRRCAEMGKPVIVATQMLESMIENPLPTRAEITDVANAVFEQADAIMLSGETTVGKHPLACIEVMDRIACRIERSGGANYHDRAELELPRQKLAKSAVVLADQLKASAIVVFTHSGNMPRYTSWLRPRWSPVHAMCERESLANQLTLLRSITPSVMPTCFEDPDGSVTGALARLRSSRHLRAGDSVVVVMPPPSTTDSQTDTLKMCKA